MIDGRGKSFDMLSAQLMQSCGVVGTCPLEILSSLLHQSAQVWFLGRSLMSRISPHSPRAVFSPGHGTDINSQVYTLEKVLKMKKDTLSQVVFLDEAMKVCICRHYKLRFDWVLPQLLENKPSATFWTSLGRALEKYTRDSVRSLSLSFNLACVAYPITRVSSRFHLSAADAQHGISQAVTTFPRVLC